MCDGIEKIRVLIKESKYISDEIDKLIKDETIDFDIRCKVEAEKYLPFYKEHIREFDICNICLTYHNNWILIDSIQTVFFINLNFKLLNIVNNIKNRRPNLEKGYPKIETYKNNNDSQTLFSLGYEIKHFLVDIDFMARYWLSFLDYLGYDPAPVKLYMELFKKEYPEYDKDLSDFLKLPASEQSRISQRIKKKTAWIYFKYKIKNFFN